MIRSQQTPLMVMVLSLLLLGACLPALAAPATRWAADGIERVVDRVGNQARGRATRGIREIGASVPVTGVVRLLAIPVEFTPDTDPLTSGTGTFPYRTWGPAAQPGYLENRLRQVAQYFAEVSGNRLQLATTLSDIVRLPNNMAFYQAKMNGKTIAEVTAMIKDTIALTDAKVDFSAYDIIILIHAGGASENNPMTGNKDIWSHYMTLSAGTWLTTNDPAVITGWGVLPETHCNDGIFKLANATLNIQDYERNPSAYPNVFVPHFWDVVGVWAHELGHAFGLPDLYDTKYAGGLTIGDWSLMSTGGYLPQPDTTEPAVESIPYDPARPYFGSVPCHPDAWCKQLLGWTTTIYVTDRRIGETIQPQAASTGFTYRLWTNGNAASTEYFLVENRAKVGFDRYLPNAGLLIYHIDDTVGTFAMNDLQIDALRPRVKPMAADNTLERVTAGTNAFYFLASKDAAFPGTVNNTHFGANTTPSSVGYTGTDTFVDVRNIRVIGNNVIADLQTSTGAAITFVTPTNGSTLFVTKPTIRVSAPYLDPATLTVTLNGQLIIGAARGNVATYYDANSGLLIVPLDGTLAGPLTLGDYQLVVSGQDAILATVLSATLNFSVQQKTMTVIGRGKMFSIPATDVGSISTVFLGGLGGAAMMVSRWDPTLGAGEYRSARLSDQLDAANPLQLSNATGAAYDRATLTALPPAGKAYWLFTEQATSFSVSMNMPGNLLPNGSQYVVPIYKGFNMIGNPYNFPVAFGSLLVEYNGSVYSASEAAQAHLIDPVIYAYLDPVASGSPNGSYAVWTLPGGTLEPWEGYWIRALVGTAANPLRLIFQPVSAGRAVEIAGPMRTRGSENAWEITLKAASLTGAGAACVTLGVVPGATDGIDAGVDLYAPPPAPAGVSLASAPTRGGGALFRDYRQSASTLTWQVDVSGPARSTLTVTWPDLTRLPAQTRAILHDPVTGAERYLRTAPSYQLTLGAEETSRRLTVRVSPETAATALQIQGLRAQRTRASGALISCALSQPARVTVEIRTATGRLVRRLAGGSRAAGSVAISWDGKDAYGRAVPGGTYHCQVSAVTGNGQAAKAMTLLPAR